jgi:hypothetical protein
MGEYMPDINLLTIEVYRRYEPKLVAADIKHKQITHFVNATEGFPQGAKVREVRF